MKKNSLFVSLAFVLLVSAGGAQAQLQLPSPEEPDTSGEPSDGEFLSLPPRQQPTSESEDSKDSNEPAPRPSRSAEQRSREPDPRPVMPAPLREEPEEGSRSPGRSEAEASGLSYETMLTLDYFSNVAGGATTGSALVGLWQGTVELDTGAMGLWEDGTVYVDLMYGFGTSPSDYAGDYQGISNIDPGDVGFAVYEAWYEHAFPYAHGSLRLGVLDYNNDFDIAEYGNVFINGAFGLDTAVGNSFAVSTYPRTTIGGRLRFQPSPHTYFMLGGFDGGAGDAQTSAYVVDRNEGSLWVTEFGLDKGEAYSAGYYKLGLGMAYLKRPIDHFTEDEPEGNNPPAFQGNPYPGTGGVYLTSEMSLGDNMGLFFKAARSDAANNRFSTFYAAGMTYAGLIPGRAEDVIGAGFVQTRHSDTFIQYVLDNALNNGNGYFRAESAYELTYSAQIARWLMIQPDFQYVLQPGFDPTIGNAIEVGVRLQMVY